jgi:hypothetical protein
LITFNWDLTLERTLWDDSDGLAFWYSYPPDSSEPSVTLLKPHGSIDWFKKANIPKGKVKVKKGTLQSLDGAVSVFTQILKRTWRGIYRAVSHATELFIFGYSLPKEDQFARLVLGRALRSNRLKVERKTKAALKVVVVNPDEAVETTFRKLVGPNVPHFSFYQATFENFVAGAQDSED